ncbi:metallophosphoesterase [Saliphagus infecundisoli]|uniref:Phosphoesterase n=1 Tax=Saliphagus infecundisoli TaxID=1849069 RepID=A0ABD5QIG8_9EURY|nr:metallophosphoesterase [Saliphagus infecundisoli]
MQVGIIADTHDNVEAIEDAVAIFEAESVDTVVHCGDFIAPPVLPFFEGLELHGVLGNNDGEVEGLEAGFADLAGSELHGRFADLTFEDSRFAVLHGEDREDVEGYAESGEYDFVCYGHHHEREQREVGETTVINPGAQFPTVPSEHRTVAVVDTETEEVRFERIG